MSEITLHPDPQGFPSGTTIKCYAAPLPEGAPLKGVPAGVAAAEAVVAANGSLTFTGLTEGSRYVAYSSVGSVDRYVFFQLYHPTTIAEALLKGNNLSDVGTPATALANIGGASTASVTTEKTAREAADTTHAALTTAAHGGIVASTDARLTDQRVPSSESVTDAKVASGAAISIRKIGLRAVATKAANYTLTTTDDYIVANGTGGSFTLTLPTAVGVTGREYTIKANLSGVNVVTVATTGGQTIDEASTIALSLSATYKGITVVSDGANWWIV